MEPDGKPEHIEMPEASDELSYRLLSERMEMSAPERDAMRANLIAAARPRKARKMFAWPIAAGALAAASVAVLVVPQTGSDPSSTFSTKGGSVEAPFLVTHCDGVVDGAPCARGAKLVLEVNDFLQSPFFAAFARHADGSVVWYVPSTDKDPILDLRKQEVSGVVDWAILLDESHPPGAYQVTGVFSKHPITRGALKVILEGDELPDGIEIRRRSLEVR